ncbi:MAG: hypothetical protein ACRD3S_04410 [Terracidiphilus sp.]
MTSSGTTIVAALVHLVNLFAGVSRCRAVELTVSRDALERTLKQQLFSGPNCRYYLKGNAHSPCFISTEDPHLSFEQDRIIVRVKTTARMGKAVAGACVGFSMSLPAEVSLEPMVDGETIGFRDAQLDRVSDRKEINFVLAPFLRGQVPKSMRVNAADLLRAALVGSTATSGYKVSLDRLKIHSVQIAGDKLIVNADADLSVQ